MTGVCTDDSGVVELRRDEGGIDEKENELTLLPSTLDYRIIVSGDTFKYEIDVSVPTATCTHVFVSSYSVRDAGVDAENNLTCCRNSRTTSLTIVVALLSTNPAPQNVHDVCVEESR